ncbi:MAG: hypothetical protein ABWZ66_09875 [Pyrinomonadaceae bacterium]
MKLRLRDNSLRLRLLQSEITRLKETGSVSEAITFGASQILIYRLQISLEAQAISARFQNNEIIVEIPVEIAGRWINTEQVGLKTEQTPGDGKALLILIEKDFVCIDRPFDADNKDAFPHPKIKC